MNSLLHCLLILFFENNANTLLVINFVLSCTDMDSLRRLSKELQTVAEAELNENRDNLEENVAALREWLKERYKIDARTDNQFLVNFLRCCKYSLGRTKDQIDAHYTFRHLEPDIFQCRVVSDDFLEFIKTGALLPLPATNGHTGPRIILFRTGAYDPQRFHFRDIFKWSQMILDILFEEDDNTIVCGIHYVTDLQGSSIAGWSQITSDMVKNTIVAAQKRNPYRIKGIDFIHMDPFFVSVLSIIKTFLSDKLKSRVRTKIFSSFKIKIFFPDFCL